MYLALTDGETTLPLMWEGEGSPYQLAAGGWAPTIATRDVSFLTSRIVGEVTETLTIHVHGGSPQNARSRLADLIRVCEAGQLWARGARRFDWPLRLLYTPTGGTGANNEPWSAICMADINQSAVTLPATYHADTNSWVIQNVRIQLVRRGRWLGPRNVDPLDGTTLPVAPEERATLATGVNGFGRRVTLTFTGGDDAIVQPIRLMMLSGALTAGGGNRGGAFWFVHGATREDGRDGLQVWRPNAGTATGYTSAASALSYSTHGNVLRFTPPSAGVAYQSGALAVADGAGFGSDYPWTPQLVVATMRSVIASGAPSYTITMYDAARRANITPITFTPTSQEPYVVVLGVCMFVADPRLIITAASAVAGNYLEIDNVITMAMDRPETRVIHWTDGMIMNAAFIAGADWLDSQDNIVFSGFPASHAGPANLDGSAEVQTVILTPSGADWRPNNGGAATQPVYYAHRRRACLLPE